MSIDAFPIGRSVRHFLDAVSYSNPVPHWHDYRDVDYASLEGQLRERMRTYLAGSATPAEPFRILIPDRASPPRRWLVPSVHDQIILETTVARLAKDIAPTSRARVYSYRYQELPDELAFYEDNFGAWARFQEDTNTRVEESKEYVLRLDLRLAFASFDRERVFAFVRERASDPDASQLFTKLIASLDPGGEGLPHINDSTFYVGNAYLAGADRAVEAVTRRFIRYIDNYHVFASSREEALGLALRIEASLADAGFALNPSKTEILDPDEYGVSVSDMHEGIEDDISYLSAPIGGKVKGGRLAAYVHSVVENPDAYLTKSFGRLVLGILRQARAAGGREHAEYLKVINIVGTPFLERALAVLDRSWAAGSVEEWRTLWLLYMLHDFRSKPEVRGKLDELAARSGPEIGKLWIRRLMSSPRRIKATSPIHQRGYLEEGRALYGD